MKAWMLRLLGIGLALQMAGAGSLLAAEQSLASVKALFASASYEEALAALTGLEGSEATELVEQYRALCLLGLGRTADAERSLERIVVSKPLYVMPAAEVSPRLITIFQTVRKRTLPVAARTLYSSAKASYDAKDFTKASTQFEDLLKVLADRDAAADSALGELRQLADGFLSLSKAQLAAATPAPAPEPTPVTPAPPAAPPAAVATAATAKEPDRIYTAAEENVSAPRDIEVALPRWTPTGQMARMLFQGVLEIVINESGTVDSATIVEKVAPLYDDDLLAAARNWRFRPATVNGKPVKYRKQVRVVLRPLAQE
jgi:TonB family protein